MANNFLAYKGFKVGNSLVEKNTKNIIDKIYTDAKRNNCKIFIPEDCNVGTSFDSSSTLREIDLIKENEIILNII